jgi:hypothetical protein
MSQQRRDDREAGEQSRADPRSSTTNQQQHRANELCDDHERSEGRVQAPPGKTAHLGSGGGEIRRLQDTTDHERRGKRGAGQQQDPGLSERRGVGHLRPPSRRSPAPPRSP